MKFIDENMGMRDADSGDEVATISVQQLEQDLASAQQEIIELPAGYRPEQKAKIQNHVGELLIDLNRKEDAFDIAREAYDVFVEAEQWEDAVQSCNVMFLAEQPYSLAALGQGVWLAVTFPIDAELTVAMLQHIIDETPEDSDGAAIAAATASYVVDMRAPEGKQRDNLMLFTNHMLGTVARRHGDVSKQEQFDYWMEKLELNDPAKFLVRLRNIVDVLVQDDWWVDRDAIWASLPDQ
jgi:hypothetical protein